MNKKEMRSDVKYIRELLRQLAVAMKENNVTEIEEITNEISCAAGAIGQEASN